MKHSRIDVGGNQGRHIPDAIKTGWPAPPLAQDDDRKLFAWFASKPDARQRVREAIPGLHSNDGGHSFKDGVSFPIRECTCHPDDSPPRPCPQRFALSECRDTLPTPQEAADWTTWAMRIFALVTFICVVVVVTKVYPIVRSYL